MNPDADRVSDNPEWRVGRKLGRTIYRDDEFVGVMDTRELAARVVDALNDYRAQEGIDWTADDGSARVDPDGRRP